jgi:hypothetical protein
LYSFTAFNLIIHLTLESGRIEKDWCDIKFNWKLESVTKGINNNLRDRIDANDEYFVFSVKLGPRIHCFSGGMS